MANANIVIGTTEIRPNCFGLTLNGELMKIEHYIEFVNGGYRIRFNGEVHDGPGLLQNDASSLEQALKFLTYYLFA